MARSRSWSPYDFEVAMNLLQKSMTPKPFVTRRLPEGLEEEIQRYARDTGLMMWAWNLLHAHMFEIFWYLLALDRHRGDTSHPLANSLWHQIQNDSTQRQMMMEAARAELSKDPATLRRVTWLFSMADKYSVYRNIPAHVPAIFSPHIPKRPSADKTASRLQAGVRFDLIDHGTFWRMMTGDLIALRHYALRLSRPIFGFREPWPRRPRLRALGEMERINQAHGLRMQSLKPKPRKKASPKKGGKAPP
jgi:hypothetical protein